VTTLPGWSSTARDLLHRPGPPGPDPARAWAGRSGRARTPAPGRSPGRARRGRRPARGGRPRVHRGARQPAAPRRPVPLGTVRQPSGKRLTVFALAGDLDADAIIQQHLRAGWQGVGASAGVPEIDRAAWFGLDDGRPPSSVASCRSSTVSRPCSPVPTGAGRRRLGAYAPSARALKLWCIGELGCTLRGVHRRRAVCTGGWSTLRWGTQAVTPTDPHTATPASPARVPPRCPRSAPRRRRPARTVAWAPARGRGRRGGTTALNAVTYLDMVVRGRAASDAARAGRPAPGRAGQVDVGGSRRERQNRFAGLGPPSGIAAGIGVGALAGVLRSAGCGFRPWSAVRCWGPRRWPPPTFPSPCSG
jgi:hypothetical protein